MSDKAKEVNSELEEKPQWQPLDLDSMIQNKLCSIGEKAEADAIERLELRRELRRIGR